ncbi:hypothetical protein R8871_02532 [Paraburkholderia graminis C4D1M]|uniref:Uncharacterized protein n=1 Tax=Paraburkholderia graminis (strain ATCC 700544 / DSM 17151 / LMG 18924 / NCIMB 13744 / C4D1M) TaxID=396598 RepID=B1G5M7_PARG4|nr:hypothetical protein [Paraburkholderia graminis]EDT08478.1 hypothetical protein BgramDRAFT_4631 [Paraburkholderia graminis C4D1M]CAB3681447.1 hypothetical protein R8871_02532 [Paraburkholderia graminis C4D1M]
MDSDIFFIEGTELGSLKEHPLCAFVPASAGVAVRDAIAQPVVLLDAMILDGRARVREARRLDLACPCRVFDAVRDEHPVLLVTNEAREHPMTTAQRAVMAAHFVNLITSRPAWLDSYDRGLADRLRTQRGRAPLLLACGISTRTYQRVQGIHDNDLLQAVADQRVPLRLALGMWHLSAATRRRLLNLPRGEGQKVSIEHATSRARGRRRQLYLPGIDNARGERVLAWTSAHEIARYTVPEAQQPWPAARNNSDAAEPPTGDSNE